MAGKSNVPISLIPKTKNSAPPKAPRQIKVSKEAEARIIMLQEEQLTLHERFRMIAEQFAIKLKFDSEPSKVARGQAFRRQVSGAHRGGRAPHKTPGTGRPSHFR